MKVRIAHVEHLAWILVLVILFGQMLFSGFSILSNLALAYISIMQITRIEVSSKKYYAALIGGILLLMGYSVFLGNSVGNATRFALIIVFILSAYSWKVDSRVFLRTLFYVSSIVVLGLIGLEIFLFSISNAEYLAIRNEIVLANNMGDVFNYHDIYFKLELRGTPLIVFVYMLSYVAEVFPSNYKWIFRIYYLVGALLAGNFAYQLAIIIFHFVYYMISAFDNPQLLVKKVIRLSIILVFVGGTLFSFVSDTMKAKNEAESNPIRYDQAEVLLNDMSKSVTTLLLGSGLGHTMSVKTSWRDYRESTYYELQTLYIFNQLGLIGFTLLVIANIVLAFRTIRRRELLMVYGVYATYAFTNPYIWDTNHIVVIVSLLCAQSQLHLKQKKNEKGNLCLSPVQSIG